MPTDADHDRPYHAPEIDRRRAVRIAAFVRAFQRLPVSVTPTGTVMQVHPPYMMQCVSLIERPAAFGRLAPRHQARLRRVQAARATAPAATRRWLAQRLVAPDGRERHVGCGRGTATEIRALLQAAVDAGIVPASGESGLAAADLRRWLKRYGIGIDCSGFVQHALVDLLVAEGAAAAVAVGFLRCGTAYRSLADGSGLFDLVATPGAARPGDILVSHAHMRLVIDVAAGADGACVVRLAESTSARDVPVGGTAAEADIGPRVVEVRYAAAGRPIAAQRPAVRRLGDAQFVADEAECGYVVGRCRLLN